MWKIDLTTFFSYLTCQLFQVCKAINTIFKTKFPTFQNKISLWPNRKWYCLSPKWWKKKKKIGIIWISSTVWHGILIPMFTMTPKEHFSKKHPINELKTLVRDCNILNFKSYIRWHLAFTTAQSRIYYQGNLLKAIFMILFNLVVKSSLFECFLITGYITCASVNIHFI